MATPSQALAKHFSDNWSHTAISWANFNAFFDAGKTRTGFTNNELWVEPKVEFIDSVGQSVNPTAFAKKVEQYLFHVNIVGKRDSGTSNFAARCANLVTLYNRTSFTNESVTFYFREGEVFDGFVREDDYWEVPFTSLFGVSV
tara:strand:+ start:1090 stop:1518 length:429 start_codon:yes stop_codon:yes gene_type:complete